MRPRTELMAKRLNERTPRRGASPARRMMNYSALRAKWLAGRGLRRSDRAAKRVRVTSLYARTACRQFGESR
jgi:hypothetical protein